MFSFGICLYLVDFVYLSLYFVYNGDHEYIANSSRIPNWNGPETYKPETLIPIKDGLHWGM